MVIIFREKNRVIRVLLRVLNPDRNKFARCEDIGGFDMEFIGEIVRVARELPYLRPVF